MEKIKLEDVKFSEDFYPRTNFDNETVNSYRLNIDKLPPIIVTREGHYLVDGYHRLLAHKLEGLTEIEAEFLDIPKEAVLWEAAKLNAVHGKQLERSEKQRLAHFFYKNNGCTLQEISDALAVSSSTLSNWLRNVMQEMKEEQKNQIINLYLQCLTYDEICTKVHVSKSTISETVQKFTSELSEQIPESLQLFNVWNFSKRASQYGLNFKGAIPGQIVENVLYYFSKPFDVVVDPMAGGGTTIDVCKAMFRRYRAYDIDPVRDDIKKHDVTEGFPKESKNCDLIFLDPPYFNMVFKDLFKNIDAFYDFIRKLARHSFYTIKQGGIVAFLMQDMTELGNFCLSGASFCFFESQGFQTIAHISCPLTTQQFLPQQVEKAKGKKVLLGRNRDLYIFQKGINNS